VAIPLIADSDVALVSLSKGIYKVAYPSKILTYLGLGVPILGMIEPYSEMARELRKAKVGVIPVSDSAEHIAEALSELLDRNRETEKIKDWYELSFSRKLSVKKWREILEGFS
jgi:glutamate racemase